MWRLIIFLLLVLGLGFLFAWFADRPGEVSLVWQDTRYQTSLMVVVAGVAALVAAIMFAWWVVSTILRSPAIMQRFLRNRRRDRGYHALSRGLIAAGSGDAGEARKLARESRRLLGGEPLVELLDAQTLLLEDNHDDARGRFEKMLDADDTKLVALRGLYLEAEREGAGEAARHYAEEATKLAPSLTWAGTAMLHYQSAAGEWEAALRTLETMRAAGAIGKEEAQRKRAVLLTAHAMEESGAAPDKAAKLAREAHRLAEDLVPAATVAAEALSRQSDVRRASNILEATWKKNVHPEIADAYVHVRSGDSVLDRLKRARKLARMQPDATEGRLCVAEAAIAAQNWKAAREAIKPVLEAEPTQRAFLLMADIEEGEHGDKGRARDWLARAVRAPRDATWTADGHTSENWLPFSPVTGRLDAFEWKVPTALLGAPAADVADMPDAEPVDVVEAEAEEIAPAEIVEAEAEDVPQEAAPKETEEKRAEETAGKTESPPAETVEDAKAADAAPPESEKTEEADDDAPRQTVFPLERRPDDPGVEPEEDQDKQAFRLF